MLRGWGGCLSPSLLYSLLLRDPGAELWNKQGLSSWGKQDGVENLPLQLGFQHMN